MSDLAFILTGFAIVVAVLSFLWLTCVVVGWFHRDRTKPSSVAIEQSAVAKTSIPGTHLAAISAALATVIPGPHRIVRVYAPGHKATGWVDQGRAQRPASHRVRSDWATRGPNTPPGSAVKQETHENK